MDNFFFLGCTLLFSRETNTDTLRVFDSYSSIKLKTLPRESCEAKETFFMTKDITSGWKQLQGVTPPFYIRHEDRKKKRHAHFLEVCEHNFFYYACRLNLHPLFSCIFQVTYHLQNECSS